VNRPDDETLKQRVNLLCQKLEHGYMMESGADPEDAFDPADRYLVHTMTDGCDDGWIDFMPTLQEVAAKVAECVSDEWGVVGIYDLWSSDYKSELQLDLEIVIGGASCGTF
jgi:hypothetical protein